MTIEDAKQLVEHSAKPGLAGDMELLLAISQDFVGSPAMGETLANAIRQIMAYMATEAASIFLLDASTDQLTCLACAGPVSIEGLRIARSQGIVGRALASNAVQMVRDVSADGDFPQGGGRRRRGQKNDAGNGDRPQRSLGETRQHPGGSRGHDLGHCPDGA